MSEDLETIVRRLEQHVRELQHATVDVRVHIARLEGRLDVMMGNDRSHNFKPFKETK